MKLHTPSRRVSRGACIAAAVLMVAGIAGCAGEVSSVDRAEAQVAAKERAVTEAEAGLEDASAQFCESSGTYVVALDRYGDVLHDSAPTVGDVRRAGTDLAAPREEAFEGADDAVEAQRQLYVAQQELAEAHDALERAKAGPSGTPSASATPPPTPAPLAPAASVERVEQADADFAAAQGSITDQTTLKDASEQFNSAAVALEFAWLRLFADAGCIPDEQAEQAQQAVSAYVSGLQQNLTDAGYYGGEVDGVYGPDTVAAVEELQKANDLPVTGTVDNATAAALQAELLAAGGEAAAEVFATTAAVQQTLKLAGFWDGPIDGTWTPELTDAVKAFQKELGVEPTGEVDSATVTAFHEKLAELSEPEPSPSAEPTPSPTPPPTPTEEAPPEEEGE